MASGSRKSTARARALRAAATAGLCLGLAAGLSVAAQGQSSIVDLLREDEAPELTLGQLEAQADAASGPEALKLWRDALAAYDAEIGRPGPSIPMATLRGDRILEALIASALAISRSAEAGETTFDAVNPDEREPLALAGYAAGRLSTDLAKAWAMRDIASVWLDRGEFVRGLATLRRAEALTAGVDDLSLQTLARHGIAEAALRAGAAGLRFAEFVLLKMRGVDRRAEMAQTIARARLTEMGVDTRDRDALMSTAASALEEKRTRDAAQLAAATPAAEDVENDPRAELIAIATRRLVDEGDYRGARLAALAIDSADLHGELSEDLAAAALDAGLISDAQIIARLVFDAGSAVKIWGAIGEALAARAYQAQAEAAFAETTAAARRSGDATDLARAAAALANGGRLEEARGLLADAVADADSAWLDRARAAIVRGLAQSGEVEPATALLAEIDDEALADRALGALAPAVAAAGQNAEARALADRVADPARRDAILRDVASRLSHSGAMNEARAAIDAIETDRTRSAALAEHAAGLFDVGRKDDADAALSSAKTLAAGDAAKAAVARTLARMGRFDEAFSAAREVVGGRAALQGDIGAMLAGTEPDAALTLAARFDMRTAGRIHAAAGVALNAAGRVEDGLAAVRAIPETRPRVAAFRRIAEQRARSLDSYGLLTDGRGAPKLPPRPPATVDNAAAGRGDYVAATTPGQDVGATLPPAPTDLVTADALRARVPPVAPGRITLAIMHYSRYNEKFLVDLPRWQEFSELQGKFSPEFLFLEHGVYDLASIYEHTFGLDGRPSASSVLERVDGKTYLLRLPMLVGPNATLIVRNGETLRLSQERGAFIINAGEVHMMDSDMIGWREADDGPAYSTYEDRDFFRPFALTWSGGLMNAASVHFLTLGYQNAKSYGISYSAGPAALLKDRDVTEKRPVGNIVDSSFEQAHYAFYSYEADDIQLVGNELRDNIIYGLDPHDRSHRLVIAYNTAYGTVKKHGIIISREVDDTWIYGNISFDNEGSGIMIDRDSTGAVLYANSVIRNHQDGITFFESPCGIAAANYIAFNERVGLKARNSWDIGLFGNTLYRNTGTAIEAYIAELRALKSHRNRDFDLDPYELLTSLAIAGNQLQENASGISFTGVNTALIGQNRWIRQSPKLFSSELRAIGPRLLSAGRDGEDIAVANRCAQPTVSYRCPLKESGHLPGAIGQDIVAPSNLGACKPDVSNLEDGEDGAPGAVPRAADAPPVAQPEQDGRPLPAISVLRVADADGKSILRMSEPQQEQAQ